MFLLLINLCILTQLLTCICHDQTVPRAPKNMRKARIASGYNCSTNDHPYMIKLFALDERSKTLSKKCSGTLLTPGHVLTVAIGCTGFEQFAVAGANSPNMARRWIVGNGVCTGSKSNIAVLMLESPFELSRYIAKVHLPSKALSISDFDRLYENKKGLILGWGWPHDPEELEFEYPDELHCAKVPIIGRTACINAYSEKIIQLDMTCTYEENKGHCLGDAGGPLMSEDNIQIGIATRRHGWGRKGRPDVYIRTDQHLGCLEQYSEAFRLAQNTAVYKNLNVFVWLLFAFIIIF